MEALGGESGFERDEVWDVSNMASTMRTQTTESFGIRWTKMSYFDFYWTSTPSTKQILLAKELWAYEILCDVVAQANNESTGSHNATIPYITQLAVGYRVLEKIQVDAKEGV